jgi:hypothetical protein
LHSRTITGWILCRSVLETRFIIHFFINIGLNINPIAMAKGQNARKEDKKKPVKTLKEKRAEKKEKRAGKN